jgi:hypothetical protein
MGNIEDNTWEMLTLEERIELENLCNQLRLSFVSKSFYCLGDSFGESGKCDKQCDDCREKILKQQYVC